MNNYAKDSPAQFLEKAHSLDCVSDCPGLSLYESWCRFLNDKPGSICRWERLTFLNELWHKLVFASSVYHFWYLDKIWKP